MKTVVIEAQPRPKSGKGSARSTRREGRIPGVLYGQGKNVPLSIDRRTFVRAIQDAHGENLIFDVTLPGEGPLKAIAREIQIDPISQGATHVDFQHIDLSKPIQIDIVVNLLGEAEGVKNFGGILEQPSRSVEIEVLPISIPSSIDIDVSHLMIGDSLHVSDLPNEGWEFLDDPTKVVAHVASPTVAKTAEEETAEAEAEAEAEAAAEAKTAEGAGAKDGGES